MKPTICILKSRRFPGSWNDIVDGGTANVMHVVDGLVRNGVSVEAFTRVDIGGVASSFHPNLKIYKVPYQAYNELHLLDRDLHEGHSFVSSVTEHPCFEVERYTCIATHHWTSGVGLVTRLPTSVRLIHTPHLLAREKARCLGVECPQSVLDEEVKLLSRSDVIIALSQSEQRTLIREYGVESKKIEIVPNGVSEYFRGSQPLPTSPRSQLRVVSIGRLCRQKGTDTLLAAFDLLDIRARNLSLVLIGSGYGEVNFEASVRDSVIVSPLRDQISIVDRLPNAELPSVLRKAEIYVQASRYESQGVAILEAMACGCAVIASDLPAIREYAISGVNALLVPPENPQAIADAIWTLYTNSEFRAKLSRRARATAEKFRWSSTVTATTNILLNRTTSTAPRL